MVIRQRLMMGPGKTPFDEIPITELGLPGRATMYFLKIGITTIRTAVDVIKQGDASLIKSSVSRYFIDLETAVKNGGYLDGASLDYHHLVSFSGRLAWLAETQHPDGHWRHRPEQTIGATLSFIRAGHTSTQGEYASIVARGVRSLEQTFAWPRGRVDYDDKSPFADYLRSGIALKNSVIAYSLLCVLAENYDMPRPQALFEPPPTSDFKSIIEARRWALLIGNAPLYGWSDGEWNMFYDEEEGYSSDHGIEFAWMTVGAPRPTSR